MSTTGLEGGQTIPLQGERPCSSHTRVSGTREWGTRYHVFPSTLSFHYSIHNRFVVGYLLRSSYSGTNIKVTHSRLLSCPLFNSGSNLPCMTPCSRISILLMCRWAMAYSSEPHLSFSLFNKVSQLRNECEVQMFPFMQNPHSLVLHMQT